tara:strand:- start:297 stop:476 length:180 start_codon:yes stop_codon:yes gene_type:complete
MVNMADIHTIAECTKKLVVLLDKLDSLKEDDPMLKYKVADCQALAKELKNESEFISGMR